MDEAYRVLPQSSILISTGVFLSTYRQLILTLVRDFLRGEVVLYADYAAFDGDMDKIILDKRVRYQGKRYIINDGDIIEFKSRTSEA